MSKQTLFTCDRCGAQFTEVNYETGPRIAMEVDYHWSELSTGHHINSHSFDLCKKCSLEFKRFLGNGKIKTLQQ